MIPIALNVGTLVAELRLDDSQFRRGLSGAEAETGRSGSRIGAIAAGIGKAAAVGLGALAVATVAVGASSVKLAADFDVTMRQVGAATGTPAEGLGALSALALKMGADTVFSAKDAGAAMLELAKGGISSAEISAGALSATLTLAAAGGLSMASSATYMSNALNTFGLTARDGATVAAALAGGANASSASVESLGLALSQVGPGAKTAGLSIQETTAVLAAFDNAGIKGADSGTSLKTMLSRLVPQTEKTAGAMKELGLDFTRANGSFLSITEISEQLQRKLGKLSAEQKTTALATVFGSDATRAATVLMNEGAVGIQKYITATSDRAAADRMAAVGTEGAAGAMEQLRGSLETVKIQIGTALLPVVLAVALGLTGLTNRVGEMTPKLNGIVASITDFIAGLSMSKGETATWGAALDGAAARGNRVGSVLRTVVEAIRQFAAGATMSRGETASWGAGLEGAAAVGNRFGGVVRSVVEAVKVFFAALSGKSELGEFEGRMRAVNDAGINVRAALMAVFEAIRSGDVGQLRDGFAGASATAAGLTGGLQSLTGLLPSLGTLVGTAADVVKFLADNSGLLVDALPFLIAGFVAYKVAQSAANVAALLSLPILATQALSNFALAAAINTLNAGLGFQRVTLLGSMLAWIAHTAATVASGVAQLATRAGIILTQGAIIGITVVQWLWTAAMAAGAVAMAVLTSPIGLIVAGVALLVGGFILAWRESETFRRIVVGAINGAKDTVLTVLGVMIGAWFWWADKILFAAEKALGWTGTLGDKVSQARAGMASVAGAIQGEIDKLKGKDIVLDVKANGSFAVSGQESNEHVRFQARAAGGAIFGPGTSTSDSIPALLSDDEHVWTAEEVQKVGGHDRMYALRAAVRSGALGAFATGGAVGVRAAANIGRVVPEQYDPTEKALLSGIAGAAARGIAAAAASSSAAVPGGVAGRGNVDAQLLSRFDAWNRSLGGLLRIVSGYRSGARQAELYASYLAGTGNLAARPGSSNHEKSPAQAIDYGPASWARTPGAYAFGLKAPIRSEPWHLERAFDAGGVARGSGMMPKFTPRPERVLSPGQTEAFERLVDVLDNGGTGRPPVHFEQKNYITEGADMDLVLRQAEFRIMSGSFA